MKNLLRRAIVGGLGIVSACVITTEAFALSLDQAKGQGWIGESASGYLETVKPGNPQAEAVKNEVNQKRRQKYQEISSKNGTSLTAVERLAGDKAIQLSPPGQFVKNANGAWVRK